MKKKHKKQKISKARQKLLEWMEVTDEELTFLEGPEYDVAILGVVTGKGISAKILYSTKKIMAMLVKQGVKEGLHEDQAMEQAMEWFCVNTSDAYVGEHTPCFLEDTDD